MELAGSVEPLGMRLLLPSLAPWCRRLTNMAQDMLMPAIPLDGFPSLTHFELTGNPYRVGLQGSIPPEWRLPPLLKVLDLQLNSLTEFNASWGASLPAGLLKLHLEYNDLKGAAPPRCLCPSVPFRAILQANFGHLLACSGH
jgi:hypothetical protein